MINATSLPDRESSLVRDAQQLCVLTTEYAAVKSRLEPLQQRSVRLRMKIQELLQAISSETELQWDEI